MKKCWSQNHPIAEAAILFALPLMSAGVYLGEVTLWGLNRIVHPKKDCGTIPKIWVEKAETSTTIHIGRDQYISLEKAPS